MTHEINVTIKEINISETTFGFVRCLITPKVMPDTLAAIRQIINEVTRTISFFVITNFLQSSIDKISMVIYLNP